MQIKTTVRYHLIPIRTAFTKKNHITNAGKDMEKGDPHILLVRLSIGAASKKYEGFSKN